MIKKQITIRQKQIIVISSLLIIATFIFVGVFLWNNHQAEQQYRQQKWRNLNHVRIENNEKVNVAENVQEPKNIAGLVVQKEILKNDDKETTFKLRVTNQAEQNFLGGEVYIRFFDDNGLELGIVRSYIPPLSKEENTQLTISSELDYSNVADYEIVLEHIDS